MIADSHNDVFWKYKNKNDLIKYLEKMRNFGLQKLACVYFSYNNSVDIKTIESDIVSKFNYIKKYNFCVPAIENAWFITPKNLDLVIQLKPEYITLTHNEANTLAGGSSTQIGLTNWGKEVVSILQKHNIIVDTAHMSERTFWDFVSINKMPLFNSHTGLKSWCKYNRNITDTQIREFQQTNGYIGIALYNQFWGVCNLDAKTIANGVKGIIEKYGTNLFGLGTDFNGIDSYPVDIKDYNQVENLTECLTKIGVNVSDIDKFLCQNYMRI